MFGTGLSWTSVLVAMGLRLGVSMEEQIKRSYTIHNNCSSSVRLYIDGEFDSMLAADASMTKILGLNSGFFYTDADGESSAGAATGAIFYGDHINNHYYIFKDVNHVESGISVELNKPAVDGFCQPAICDNELCSSAFSQPPTRFTATLPGDTLVYTCPYHNLAYKITFCPSGTFPSSAPSWTTLHPNFNHHKCMDVRGAVYENGTPVQIYDCNGTGAQKWVLKKGSTKVRLAGTNYCLDAGSAPASGVGMKIWQCYDKLPAQQWDYTLFKTLKLEKTDQCLDLPDGNPTNGNQLQTWECAKGNTNQMWTE